MKFVKALFLFSLISISVHSQTINCGNFCILDIGNYDTLYHTLDVTVYNGDTNQVNYPSVRLVDASNDTIGNAANSFFLFAQLPGDTVVHTIPTSLTSFSGSFTGTVLLEDNNLQTVCSYTYPMSCTVGIPQFSKISGLFIYPNPASDLVSIQLRKRTEANSEISIFSSDGRLVYSFSSTGNVVEWKPGEELPNGIYYISVLSDNYRTTKRIVLKK